MLRIRGSSLIYRHYSSGAFKAADIRRIFLDYFMEVHGHKFVRSSPVVPFCDPSVAFVNAGMNQFKSVFLGKTTSAHPRVVNSQKCVRVGGKHNDLSVVGRDGYHHTFFEMLGNWSFGDYFKKEACEMALALLEGPFNIDRSRLYVTYFGGDEQLQLPADTECFEIWRNLGFSDDRIIPFGSSENFWEMGVTGPCGPCTEIHIDHFPKSDPSERARLVNTGRSDLTELWNIVFIQYNRNVDNTITLLPQRHVDTGMGFERLVALLQNKSSNYDTDLFKPIFDIIKRACNTTQYNGTFLTSTEKIDLDTAYRIIADHSRMITACVADGMLPDQNQKLRRVLRTALLLAENVFEKENLLDEIIPVVVDILGPTYPEMEYKLQDTLEIVHYEQEIFKLLREKSAKEFLDILTINPKLQYIDLVESSGFVPAFKELQSLKCSFENSIIPGEFLFKLRDTYGLNNESIENLAKVENLKLDEEGLRLILDSRKQKHKLFLSDSQNYVSNVLVDATMKADETDDRYKYDYEFQPELSRYHVRPVHTRVTAIFQNGTEITEILPNKMDNFQIICEKSNFYCEAGGQQGDTGYIRIDNDGKEAILQVTNVIFINGCVVHSGKFLNYGQQEKLKVGDKVVLTVDSTPRTFCTIHHTATHLLNAAVREICQKVIYQVSSVVTYDNLKLELGIIGHQLNKTDLTKIEDLIREVINKGLELKTIVTNTSDILNDPDIIRIPGEIYPETNVRLLCLEDNTNFRSKELCCGTHVSNTSEIGNFCIVNFKQISRSRYAFTAVAGELAENALERANSLNSLIDLLEKELKADNAYDSVEAELLKVKKQIQHSDVTLPYVFRINSLERINALSKVILESSRTILKNLVEIEMKNLLQEKCSKEYPFIIHFLKASAFVKTLPLQRATRLCSNRPIIVISCTEGILKARCCVPSDKINDTFTAEQWLQEFAAVFKAEVSPPRGQNPKEVCNMKAKKIVRSIFDDQLEVAIKKANKFAMSFL